MADAGRASLNRLWSTKDTAAGIDFLCDASWELFVFRRTTAPVTLSYTEEADGGLRIPIGLNV